MTKRKYKATDKWGEACLTGGERGFQMIPDLLFRRQKALGLDNTSMVVLLNILMHWWDAESLPYPGVNVIAKRMGTSPRTVERKLKKLEDLELIQRLPRENKNEDISIRRIDLSKLVEKLNKL